MRTRAVAQCYFACQPLTVLGAEVEGGPASISAISSTFFALNLGIDRPPRRDSDPRDVRGQSMGLPVLTPKRSSHSERSKIAVTPAHLSRRVTAFTVSAAHIRGVKAMPPRS